MSEGTVVGDELVPGSLPGDVEIDWKHAFYVLSAALGREMISSDVLWFVGHAAKTQLELESLSPEKVAEIMRVYVEGLTLNRSKNTHDFMG